MASTATLKDVRKLADEVVRASRHTPGVEALSLLDQAEVASGSRGMQLLLKSSVAAPVLKDALVETLNSMPALAGRLVQAKDIEPRTLLRPADMRRRGVLPAAAAAAAAGSAAIASESGGFGGNAAYAARLDAVAPSGQSLGRLAAQLRQSLGHAVPQLRRSLAQARAAVRQVQQAAASGAAGSGSRGPLMLLPGSAAATHPLQCAQSPVGPVTVAAVDVRPALLKFGPELPLAVLPLPLGSTPPPNSVLVYRDSRPAPGSSAAAAGAGSATDATAATCLAVALHRATWRQLDAMYGPDLAAAI